MDMFEDDSNSGFDIISSEPDKFTFDSVPVDKVYKVKVVWPCKKFSYKLEKGIGLPYSTNVGGPYNS